MKGAIIIVIALAMSMTLPSATFASGATEREQLRQCQLLNYGNDHTRWTVRRACKIMVKWPHNRTDRKVVTVAWCEGTFNPLAKNGQYRGTFQMGTEERRKYGHGSTIEIQTVAAHRYFSYARRIGWGHGWGPWSCKPGSRANRDAWNRAPRVLKRYVGIP